MTTEWGEEGRGPAKELESEEKELSKFRRERRPPVVLYPKEFVETVYEFPAPEQANASSDRKLKP